MAEADAAAAIEAPVAKFGLPWIRTIRIRILLVVPFLLLILLLILLLPTPPSFGTDFRSTHGIVFGRGREKGWRLRIRKIRIRILHVLPMLPLLLLLLLILLLPPPPPPPPRFLGYSIVDIVSSYRCYLRASFVIRGGGGGRGREGHWRFRSVGGGGGGGLYRLHQIYIMSMSRSRHLEIYIYI